MWAGLLFSYSQSSMAALVVVTLALAVVTGDRRVRTGASAVLGAGAPRSARSGFVAYELIDGESLNHITSDRTKRVEDTARVISAATRWSAWGSAASRGPAASWPAATGRRRTSSRTPRR